MCVCISFGGFRSKRASSCTTDRSAPVCSKTDGRNKKRRGEIWFRLTGVRFSPFPCTIFLFSGSRKQQLLRIHYSKESVCRCWLRLSLIGRFLLFGMKTREHFVTFSQLHLEGSIDCLMADARFFSFSFRQTTAALTTFSPLLRQQRDHTWLVSRRKSAQFSGLMRKNKSPVPSLISSAPPTAN